MAVVEVVPTELAARAWPRVAKYFESVVPHSNGDWTLEQIKADVLTGRQHLFVVVEDGEPVGAGSFTFQNRRNARVAFIHSLGGDCITTPENWVQLRDIFTKGGATKVEAAMRPATQRLWSRLGFTEKYRVCGVDL